MTTIYIPTKGRPPAKQITYRNLAGAGIHDVVLVAPEEDAVDLELAGYPVIETDAVGISATRQWILDQHDVSKLGDHLIMMDDDLKFFERRKDEIDKFRRIDQDPEATQAMVDEMELALSYAVMAGVSNRRDSNWHTPRFRLNIRTFDTWGVHVPTVRDELGLRIDEMVFMEDFNLSLHLLTRGYWIPVVNQYVKDDAGSNSIGGCSSYRTWERQRSSALALQERWPEFVKAVEKPSRNWSGMDTRWDVTVQWKRAFEHGVRTHGQQSEIPDFFYEDSWESEFI